LYGFSRWVVNKCCTRNRNPHSKYSQSIQIQNSFDWIWALFQSNC
jgi:hypothetical protein